VGRVYDPLIFDFHYKTDHCFEQFAFDGLSMLQDFDVYCANGRRARKVISCDNMHQYCTMGVALLSGCQHSEAAGDIVEETCGWVCKNKRPVLRCKYRFDPRGVLGYTPWGLDACVLMGTCTAKREEALDITCKPRVSAPGGGGGDTSALMNEIASLQKSIIEVQGLYSDAQVTISQQQQQLASYELQDGMQFDSGVHNNITQAQLQLAAMQSNGPLGNKVMESFARNALCNTNSMIHRSSGKTQLQCFKACAEETHCNYFAEWNHSEVGDDTSCDCLLYSSCEDYEIIDNHTENVTNQSMLWHVQSASEQTGVLATQLALQIQLEDANLKLKDANLYLAEEMSKVEEEVDELQEESFFWKVGLAAAALLCVCTASGWALYARKDCKRRFCRHSGFEEGAEPEVVNNPGIVNITVHTPDCDGQTAVVGRPVFLPGQPGKKQDVASGYAGPSIGGHMEPDTQKRRLSDLKAELHQQRRQSLRSSDRESEAESWQHSRRSSRRSSGQSEAELWQQKKRSLRSSGSASQDRRRSRDTQDSSRRASSQFLATWEEQFTGMDLGINLQEEDSDTEGSSESSGDEAQRYTRRPSSLAAERRPSSTQQSLRRPSSAEGSSRRPSSTPGRSSKRTPQPRTKTSADAERQQRGSKSSAASARRSLPDEQLNIGNSRRRSHSSSEGQASLSKAPKRPQRSSLPVRAREPRHSGVSSATASSASSIDPRLSRY